jgi:polyisoprenoid-binding protein YceI
MKTVKLFVLAAVLAVSPACKKKPEAKKDTTAQPDKGSAAGSADTAKEPAAGSAAGSAAAPAAGSAADPAAGSAAAAPAAAPAEDTGDWIKVYATHVAANPADPVEVNFERFKILKADFDPKKIEGGTATIEVDMTSLKTNDPKRDEHLNTPDYVDSKKFATATIDISNVKKKDDKNFTADAKLKLHGVEKTYPVTFEVVEQKDDSIRIRGEHTFKRLDHKIGKEPNADPKKGDGVAPELKVKLQLNLKKV